MLFPERVVRAYALDGAEDLRGRVVIEQLVVPRADVGGRRVPRALRSRVRDAEVRRYSRRLLRRLDLPLPLDVAVLCERLGDLRGTPIQLMAWPLEVTGPSGLLITREHEDVIVFQANTTRAHQAHIVLHEVGHIVAQQLDERGHSLLGRTGYSDREERDAEIVASTIMHRAISMSGRLICIGQPGDRSVHGSLGLWGTWT